MIVRFIRLVLFGLLAVAQPLHAEPSAAEVLEQLQRAPARGLFYEVSKGSQKAYLFGTIHLGRPDFYPLDLATTRALVHASELVLEADLRDAAGLEAAIGRHALLAGGQTLDALLPPQLARRLHAHANARGVPREALQRLKPWMAAMTLVATLIDELGYDAQLSTEQYLLAVAGELGKPVGQLESAGEQLGLFDGQPIQDQIVFLEETLGGLERGEARADLAAMIDAWLATDGDTLHALGQKSMRETPRSAEWLEAALINDRNARMAERIESLMAKGSTPFVAVGALHLTGDDGVPALLAARGYRVTNLYPRPAKETP